MKKLQLDAIGTVTLSVSGMTCGCCSSTVERVLSRIDGVTAANVKLASGSAVVTGAAASNELIAALQAAGYGAEVASGATIGGGRS